MIGPKHARYIAPILGLSGANLANNGVAFLAAMLLSSAVSNEDFGRYSLAVSILMTASFLLDFGTSIALVRMYNASDKAQDKESFVGAAILVRIVTMLGMLLIVSAAWIGPDFMLFSLSTDTLLIALTCSISMSWWTLAKSYLQATQKYRALASTISILAAARAVSIGGIVLIGKASPEWFLIILYFVSPIVVCSLLLVTNSLCSRKVLAGPFRRVGSSAYTLTSYGKWPFISMLLFPMVNNIPLWILGHRDLLAEAGTFGIGLMFATIMGPMRDAIRAFLLPKVAGFESKLTALIFLNKILAKMYLVPIITGLIIAFALLAKKLFIGDSYPSSDIVISIMLLAQVMTIFTGIGGTLIHYLGKPWIDAYLNVAKVLLSGTLAYLIIPIYGAIGAAAAASFSIVLGEIIMLTIVKSQLNR